MKKSVQLVIYLFILAWAVFWAGIVWSGVPSQLVDKMKAASVTIKSEDSNRGFGSGVIIEWVGKVYVLTAYHVAETFIERYQVPPWEAKDRWAEKREPARLTQAIYQDDLQVGQKEFLADLVYYNRGVDLALLAVRDATGLVATGIANDLPQVGDEVFVVSSPAGLEATLSRGILAAKGRILKNWNQTNEDLTTNQHDATLYLGSSGSALFNEKGAVVGINVGKVRDANIFFAIPLVTIVKFLVTEQGGNK